MKVLSTYRILKSKAFDESIDETWIDWALEMMEAGYESDNLHILAGTTKPFNQFELHDLTERVLEDFGFSYSDKETVVRNYAYYLVSKSIDHPESYHKTLWELRDFCQAFDYNSAYMDFYLLFYAKDDLELDEVQYYWPDANRQNIDQIVKEYFGKWLAAFDQHHSLNAAKGSVE